MFELKNYLRQLVLKVSSYQADHDSVKVISQKLILFDL